MLPPDPPALTEMYEGERRTTVSERNNRYGRLSSFLCEKIKENAASCNRQAEGEGGELLSTVPVLSYPLDQAGYSILVQVMLVSVPSSHME